MARQTNIQVRRGTAADWASVNPVLAQGEPGFENDTRKMKFGDGTTAWNSLPYFAVDGGSIDGPTPTPTPTSTPIPPTPTPAGDPYFNNVSLLLHMDGTDGSTSFVDSSAVPQALTNGGVVISTAQSKFGGASAYFNGSATLNTTIPAIGTGDFALEFWVYLNSAVSYDGIFQFTPGTMVFMSDGQIKWAIGSDKIVGPTLSLGQWYHIALARDSGNTRMYVDGAQVGNTYAGSDDLPYTSALIGRWVFMNFQAYLEGYIDDLRLTVGTSRGYTGSTISVPNAAFPNN